MIALIVEKIKAVAELQFVRQMETRRPCEKKKGKRKLHSTSSGWWH